MMHITGMTIGGVPPISERITVKFDERVNVFIGPNASGKSTLLLVLANHFKALDEASQTKRPFADLRLQDLYDYMFYGYNQDGGLQFNALARSEDWMDPDANLDERPKAPIVVHIGSERTGLPGLSMVDDADTMSRVADAVISGPFSGSQVQRALDALGNEVLRGRSHSTGYGENQRNLIRAIEISNACSMRICKEVIQDSEIHHYRHFRPGWDLEEDRLHRILNPDNTRAIPAAAMNTNDVRDFEVLPEEERPNFESVDEADRDSLPIYLGHLSSGTEMTVLWIRWLAFKMVHHYGFEEGWEKRPAILLIDEIENHLHPTWQRRVIPALLEHFPGLQIFATTHSPFVVAGLKAGQVHRLYRDEEGIVRAEPPNDVDIMGWTMDEILRGFMGVQDPTDDETARHAAELRRLRDEGPRDTEDAEAARQAEMNNLRRKVDRDLLAGGPMARRREDFAKRFQEALEKRQREEELNQENG